MACLRWGFLFLASVCLAINLAMALPYPSDDQAYLVTLPRNRRDSPPSTVADEAPSESEDTELQVKTYHAKTIIQQRYAHTELTSKIYNPHIEAQEVSFSAVLPDHASITSFVMHEDDKVGRRTYHSRIMSKEEAEKIYKKHASESVSAAIVAKDSKAFNIIVSLEARREMTFNLTYEQHLIRRWGTYRHFTNINLDQYVPDMEVRVHIKEETPLTTLHVPGIKSVIEIEQPADSTGGAGKRVAIDCTSKDPTITITCASLTEAEIVYKPTAEQQKQTSQLFRKELTDRLKGHFMGSLMLMVNNEEGLKGQFAVEYDVAHPNDGTGDLLVNDGNFVHFFATSAIAPMPKHVVIVIELNTYIPEQESVMIRKAISNILDELKPHDYFNIIQRAKDVAIYDVEHLGKSITRNGKSAALSDQKAYPATPENINIAKKIVRKIRGQGTSDISDALLVALNCAKSCAKPDGKTNVKPIVVFITEGDEIVKNAGKVITSLVDYNKDVKSPIISLAYGDVDDIRFLKKLSVANYGFARRIYDTKDAETQILNAFRYMALPTLQNIEFTYPADKVDLETVTQREFPTYYAGAEIVVAGKIKPGGEQFEATVKGESEGKTIEFKSQSKVIEKAIPIHTQYNATCVSSCEPARDVSAVTRLHYYLFIKQLSIKQFKINAGAENDDGTTPKPEEQQPKNEATRLAVKKSFLTPTTTLAVVTPSKTKILNTERLEQVSVDTRTDFAQEAKAAKLRTLQDIFWLDDITSEETDVTLNLGPEGPQTYKVTVEGDDPEPPQACQTKTTSKGVVLHGECKQLYSCNLPEFKYDIEAFKPYHCKIGNTNALAVCCPTIEGTFSAAVEEALADFEKKVVGHVKKT